MRHRTAFLLVIVVALIAAGPAAAQQYTVPPATEQNAVTISATVASAPARVWAAAVQAASSLGFTVADSSQGAGQLSTAASFQWPPGSENESWHGPRSPGVALAIRVVPQGADSTHLAVTAIAPVDTSDVEAVRAAETLRMFSAVQFARTVSARLQAEHPLRRP